MYQAKKKSWFSVQVVDDYCKHYYCQNKRKDNVLLSFEIIVGPRRPRQKLNN